MGVVTSDGRNLDRERVAALSSEVDGIRSSVLDRTAEQMARLLGRPQPLAPWTLPCGTRLTAPWIRDGFHGYAAGMDGHLIAGYHGSAQRCCWSVDNRRLAGILRPGTLTLIPATHDGHWELAGKLKVSHVYLSDERLRSCLTEFDKPRSLELVGRVGFEDPAIARLLGLLSDEASSQSAPTLFVDEALDLLCLQLVRRHSAFSHTGTKPPTQGLTPKQLRLVTGYMREHLDRDITLQELSGLLHLSRFHFCTAFRLATGTRPHEWLTMQRIERARTLLHDHALRIIDVGQAVGYQTPSAFAAAFRRVVGDTPSNYRRKL